MEKAACMRRIFAGSERASSLLALKYAWQINYSSFLQLRKIARYVDLDLGPKSDRSGQDKTLQPADHR